MMLRTKATGQRLIANRTIARSRLCSGHNYVLKSRHQPSNRRRSYAWSASSLHLRPTQTSVFDDNIQTDKRGIDRCNSTIRYFSSPPVPDLNFGGRDDGEPFESLDQSPHFESDAPFHDNHTDRSPRPNGNPDKIDNTIPKQSSQAARILFNSIAPHIEFRTLHQMTKQITHMLSQGQHHLIDSDTDKSGKKRALKRRLGIMFHRERSSSNDEYTWGIKGQVWIESILYQFLMGKFLDHPIRHNNADVNKDAVLPNSLSYQNDPTYPPNINRGNYENNLRILMGAREMSLEYPMFWTEKVMSDSGYFIKNGKLKGKKKLMPKATDGMSESQRVHGQKSQSQLAQDAVVLLELLMYTLPQPHFEKLMRELGKFAEVDGNVAEQKRESWYIKDDAETSKANKGDSKAGNVGDQSSFSKWLELKEIAPKETKQNRITVLGTALHKISSSHSHLVAVELAKYFYVDGLPKSCSRVSEKMSSSSTDEKMEPSEDSISTDWIIIRPQDAMSAIKKHNKLSDSHKRYQKLKDKFVDKMIQLQHEFASWEDTEGDDIEGASDDSSEDTTTDLLVKEFQKDYKVDAQKHQKESLAETLNELRKMGLRNEGEGKDRRGRRKKGTHLRFTVVKMEEDKSSLQSGVSDAEAELEQRIVFINNLPVDATQEEIDQIYSRCGPLDSVELFNLRPDIDPGPLNKKQREERRRKQRMGMGNSDGYAPYQYQKQSRQRPRTPVYGILKFQTAEGFNIATSPDMSLFGCVIRRHPVMSLKPNQMKSLYIENIPENLLSIELEYKLAVLLHPHQMFVMQDGMRGVGNVGHRYNVSTSTDDEKYSNPSSCEVKFENFHAALKAYDWIKGENETRTRPIASFLEGDDCEVHWFRTPADKMKYWTRELTF